MKNVILFLFFSHTVWGGTAFRGTTSQNLPFLQDTLRVSVRHALTKQSIPGATILLVGTSIGAATDTAGFTQMHLPPVGPYRLRISAVGFESAHHTLITPGNDTLQILLEPSEEALDEITVSSTRSGRSVADEPTRIEVIDAEELDEKANMQPANIAVILRESPGIQVQQTSVTSANATFRIQGLDGRYTQLLQDGLPLYSGFSSGLSLMQVPPLNLKQVELVKGCQSTLYGSGAIAGLVNLVTKEPTRERDLSFLINGTSALGLDLNAYYAQRNEKVGLTFYATRNLQRVYDVNNDQFSDLPQTARTTIQPKFFWYPSPTTTVSAGVIWVNEHRTGGYVPTIRSETSTGYTEANDSRRLATQFRLEKRFSNDAVLTIKNSYSRFRRAIILPDYSFDGLQQSSFSEVSYFKHQKKADWIAGLNLWTDTFWKEDPANSSSSFVIYRQNIVGMFLQNTLTLSEQFSLETGLRADAVTTRVSLATGSSRPKLFLLPRFSLLYRAADHWTSRLGGGLGYKAPTIFTEDAERLSFRNVNLGSINGDQTESSMGLNWDINYRTELGDKTTLSINQLFFYTQLNRLTVLTPEGARYTFRTANGHLSTRGFETNVRLVYHDIHGFLGYSFIDTQRQYDNLTGMIPLTAKHRLYFTTLYETDRLKTGFEAFYSGTQQRTNGTTTPAYWTLGYMIERKWSFGQHTKGSIFINFENFLDVRQSRFEPLVSGTVTQPIFVTDIYAPTDGRIINGGIKLKL
ncbi:TonB-dependent receptor plug domain-containing protein [Spirosoma sp. HMF4905]|uniref:TonB-dependent receptor plug domain-containing protein n=1 Tax=Spirosoma arboris TaxID=2682092 RepID=A0A7K1SAF3_9BACT|nr:TonB-dependent receptor [Spirosoma arboris]MVM30804.1 TonB-dependent receptor plug domain-containing protein [Spirosoma arboris]